MGDIKAVLSGGEAEPLAKITCQKLSFQTKKVGKATSVSAVREEGHEERVWRMLRRTSQRHFGLRRPQRKTLSLPGNETASVRRTFGPSTGEVP